MLFRSSSGFAPSTRAPVTVFPSSTQIATAGISAQGYAGPPPPQQPGNGYPFGRGNGAQGAQGVQAAQQPQQQQGGQQQAQQQQGNYF